MMERLLLITENRYARLFLVGLFFLALQTTIFNDMRPFGVCIQVMVLLAASAGVARGSETGAIAGFMIGMLYDLVLSTPLGLCAAVFALVGYLSGYAQSFVHDSTWWTRMILASGASAIGMIILPFAFTLTGATGVLNAHVLVVALVVALFNAVFSIPVERVCRWALVEPVGNR
jgi:rod shape-determining protein MreD